MFVHLNKKISVPNCSKVRSIAWSKEYNYIACGGDNGVLKVIKLENLNGSVTNKTTQNDSIKNLSFNQTLEGHKSTIECVTWNDSFQKLTSSDETGSIIVWMLYKSMWYEEMVNNRNKSLVSGMSWTHDGQKICIVYDDGAIITGSVDGNRIWGKEMKNSNLTKVEWSPDGKLILIGTSDLELQVFDYLGNFIKKVPLATMQAFYGRAYSYKDLPNLVSIKWIKNSPHNRPLLLAFDDGRIQLMSNQNDDTPFIIDTELKITSAEWNHSGDIIAVTGASEFTEKSGKNYLKLYNSDGEMLQSLKVPGSAIFDCSWEKSGLKLALAVDSYIFFANIKPDYSWGFLSTSIVFAIFNNKDSEKSSSLTFWDLKTRTRYDKNVPNFCQLTVWLHCCAVVAKVDNQKANEGKKCDLHSLTLYNSVGTLIDRHLVKLEVKHCCMNSIRMVVTSDHSFYIWNFNQIYNNGSSNKNLYSEHLFNELALKMDSVESVRQQTPVLVAQNDPISCITASEKYLAVGHESGTINQFLFPNATHVHKFQLNCVPSHIAFNKNSSKLSLIDKSAKFYIYDFDASNEQTSAEGNWLDIELQDTWDMKWASDNNDMIAILEKTKLIIVNAAKLEREDPVPLNGYICQFDQLCVKTATLDSLVADTVINQVPDPNAYLKTTESQYIRELRDIIEHSLTDAVNYVLQISNYPCLWHIVIEESLARLDFDTARLAMIKCKDYKGLQFIKKLHKLKDDSLKKAEVYAYQERCSDAEQIYINLDRPDLTINLNKLMGNYKRVLQLLEDHHLSDYEKELDNVNYLLGDYYADNYEWQNAVNHFEKMDAPGKLVKCYINLENYDGLVRLIDQISDSNLLEEIGNYLESMGLCRESTRAYLKANQIEMAINACVSMSEWKLAIDLANNNKIQRIDLLLNSYVDHLLNDKKYMEIIEVYKKANKLSDVTRIIMKLMNELKIAKKGDALLFKKLFVLIGLLYEENRQKTMTANKNALSDLLSSAEMLPLNKESKMIEDPWKGAEAYHFLLLAQKHLYDGQYDLAMKAALHLQDYEELIPNEELYSLIALTSYCNKCFAVCSKAFIKLEAISSNDINKSFNNSPIDYPEIHEPWYQNKIPEERQIKYEELAVTIFTTNPPNEKKANVTVNVDCKFCGESIPDYSISCLHCNTKFPPCIATGKSIMDPRQQWACKQCAHIAIKVDISQYNHCPLCHFKIN